MKRILLSSGLIVFTLGALALGSTGAFFSDSETSVGNTFAAGAIDLLVDNESYYNGVLNPETTWVDAVNLTVEKFFNFNDVKPGDYGEDTISLHVDTNDAYLCADISLTSNDDNGINEPESLVDQTDGPGNGELADAVNFIWWADDGDNVLEDNETALPGGPLGALAVGATTTITLADSETNIWEGDGGPAPGDVTLYIGKAWCFGNIGTDPRDEGDYPDGPAGDNDGNGTAGEPEDGGITCDGTLLGNETQTDSLTANISFSAVQARNNPDFLCVDEPPPPVFQACTDPNLRWADAASSFAQGTRKDGSAVLVARSNPASATGPNNSSGNPFDNPAPADNTFLSLGFNIGSTTGGSVVLEFNNNIVIDGSGADLKVWEVTGGTSYPEERIKVEISQNGSTWFIATSSAVRDAEIDIAPTGLAWAKYVRITDVSIITPFEQTADAYDLDALQALNCALPLLQLVDTED